MKRNRIKTIVDGHKTCASACALAFLGGTYRNGNRWMSTTTTSQLGFHAFRNADGTRYEDTDRTQSLVGEILEYGQVVEAPMEIFVRNFKTPSNDMYWFSTQEALSLGIKVWDMHNDCFVGDGNCGGRKDIPEELGPVSFVQEYYTKIKKVPYSHTWNMLSMSLRNKVGFDNYVDWWDRKVDRVFLQNAKAIGSNRVQVRLLYHMKNGRKICSIDTFALHKGKGTWLIHDQQDKGCTRK